MATPHYDWNGQHFVQKLSGFIWLTGPNISKQGMIWKLIFYYFLGTEFQKEIREAEG